MVTNKTKPFILCNTKGLNALPHWLKKQSFNTYSISFGKNLSISIGFLNGRHYIKTQSIVVNDEELLDDAELMVRRRLSWKE